MAMQGLRRAGAGALLRRRISGSESVLWPSKQKLMNRAAGEGDRRGKPVRLPPGGRALAELVMADVLGSDAALICSGASVGEVTTLTGRLRKLLATIEPSAGEP